MVPAAGAVRVPNFAENTSELNARQFLTILNNLRASYQWDQAQTVGAAMVALRGKAHRWSEWSLEHDDQCFSTLQKFEAAFSSRFRLSQNAGEKVRLYSGLQQTPEESSRDFYQQVDMALIRHSDVPFFKGIAQVTVPLSKFRNCSFSAPFFQELLLITVLLQFLFTRWKTSH